MKSKKEKEERGKKVKKQKFWKELRGVMEL